MADQSENLINKPERQSSTVVEGDTGSPCAIVDALNDRLIKLDKASKALSGELSSGSLRMSKEDSESLFKLIKRSQTLVGDLTKSLKSLRSASSSLLVNARRKDPSSSVTVKALVPRGTALDDYPDMVFDKVKGCYVPKGSNSVITDL